MSTNENIEQLHRVMLLIRRAKAKGLISTAADDELPEWIIRNLRRQGFKVEPKFVDGRSSISWTATSDTYVKTHNTYVRALIRRAIKNGKNSTIVFYLQSWMRATLIRQGYTITDRDASIEISWE